MGWEKWSRWMILFILGGFTLLSGVQAADRYPVKVSIPEMGCSLSLPQGYVYKGKDSDGFAYEIKQDQVKLRLHCYGTQGMTPEEAIKLSAANRVKWQKQAVAEGRRKNSVYLLFSSEPFKTTFGLKGMRGNYGVAGYDPIHVKWMIGTPDGRVICVCADQFGTKEKLKEIEDAIIQTFEITP